MWAGPGLHAVGALRGHGQGKWLGKGQGREIWAGPGLRAAGAGRGHDCFSRQQHAQERENGHQALQFVRGSPVVKQIITRDLKKN